MKKSLVMALCIALCAALATGGTLAYLQDQDEAVNVMTLGSVHIKQHEYERVQNSDGTYPTKTIDGVDSYVLKEFTQAKPLFPVTEVDANGAPINFGAGDYVKDTKVRMTQVDSYGNMDVFTSKNAQDKFVTVENTGKSDAYVRTIIAFEIGSTDGSVIRTSSRYVDEADVNDTTKTAPWVRYDIGKVVIDGKNYAVKEYIYRGASDVNRHVNGVLPAGDTTYPNLAQVYMVATATNEDVEALDGNGNGTYDILVLSQAVQTAGFADAKTALDIAFGKTADKAAEWFTGIEFPKIFSWQDVNYVTEGDTVKVSSDGGDTIYRGVLSEGLTTATSVKIGEGITRLNNRALCKAPTIQSVSLPSTLTYIDESTFQQSGITAIEIPENVTYIGQTAFGACGSLEKIVINAENVTIANYVARACANLKEVYINSDTVNFESGSMYFTNKENGDASGITFYVKDQAMADNVYAAFSTSHSYGLLIKNVDGTEYYNTLK